MIKLITEYSPCVGSFILVSDKTSGKVHVSEWIVVYNAKSNIPFEVFKADHENETYNHYGDYRTLDKVIMTINGLVDNTVANLLPVTHGSTVILQFGNDISFDTSKFADEIVNQVHFNSPTETTFIMAKQSIPIKGE